jgi:hypothetical protein
MSAVSSQVFGKAGTLYLWCMVVKTVYPVLSAYLQLYHSNDYMLLALYSLIMSPVGASVPFYIPTTMKMCVQASVVYLVLYTLPNLHRI